MEVACKTGKGGGHFTIFKFSTHYKAMIGTPNLDTGDGREEVKKLKSSPTLEGALVIALTDHLKKQGE
jgi:hypothetical protein